MKYKDVVVEENSHKVYLCKLTDGTELKLQVHDTCESAIMLTIRLFTKPD